MSLPRLLSLLLSLLATLALIPTSAAHGYLSYPAARQAGAATAAACGQAVTAAILRDNTSHVEGLPELAARAGSGYDATVCNLWLCRGIQFADNADGVQVWRAGQSVPIKVRITIPHDGSANVSIVDTRRNERLGDMLAVWPVGYANETDYFAGSLPANMTEFNVTVPDLGERCARAGDCVLQWWWYGKGARQTYESCVDFVVAPADDTASPETRSAGSFTWRKWLGLPVAGHWRLPDEKTPLEAATLSSRLFRGKNRLP